MEQAINTLIQVAIFAQSKGILSLEEAAVTARAVDFFTAKSESEKPKLVSEIKVEPTVKETSKK